MCPTRLRHRSSVWPATSEVDPVVTREAVPVVDSPVQDAARSLDGLDRGHVVVPAHQEHALPSCDPGVVEHLVQCPCSEAAAPGLRDARHNRCARYVARRRRRWWWVVAARCHRVRPPARRSTTTAPAASGASEPRQQTQPRSRPHRWGRCRSRPHAARVPTRGGTPTMRRDGLHRGRRVPAPDRIYLLPGTGPRPLIGSPDVRAPPARCASGEPASHSSTHAPTRVAHL